jgi:hypothetical protein
MVFNAVVKKFMTVLLIALFVFSALSVLPAGASDSRADQNVQNMVIKGTVIDAVTEKPIPHAKILLWNDLNEYHAETNAEGYFVFEVPHANYNIKVKAEGYHPAEEFLKLSENTELSLRFALKPVEVRPDPMIVFGHVYDEKTELPIFKAIILFIGNNMKFEAVTGELGGFEIKLPPGGYVVEVTKEGYSPARLEVKGESNDEVKITVALTPIPDDEKPHYIVVEGTVFVAETDRPIPKAWVVFKNKEGHVKEIHTDEKGNFRIELPEGFYEVHAGAEGFHDTFTELELMNIRVFYLELFLKPIKDDEPVQYGAIKGVVLNAANGEPIAGAVVVLIRPESPRSDIPPTMETKTDREGGFAFEDYRVRRV